MEDLNLNGTFDEGWEDWMKNEAFPESRETVEKATLKLTNGKKGGRKSKRKGKGKAKPEAPSRGASDATAKKFSPML